MKLYLMILTHDSAYLRVSFLMIYSDLIPSMRRSMFMLVPITVYVRFRFHAAECLLYAATVLRRRLLQATAIPRCRLSSISHSAFIPWIIFYKPPRSHAAVCHYGPMLPFALNGFIPDYLQKAIPIPYYS